MKKSYYVTAAVLGLLITTAAVGITSFAATNNPDFSGLAEKRQAIRQAVTDGDYDSWAAVMQEKVQAMRDRANEMEGRINQETFDKFQEAHQLMQDGDVEGAKAIFEELGMKGPGPRGMNKGFHKGFRLGHKLGSQE